MGYMILFSVNPFSNIPFWDHPKFKEAADDNWNVSVTGLQDTDCIGNIVEKGEIAHFEQFHLFPKCFPKLFFFSVLKWVYMEKRVKLSDFVSSDLDYRKPMISKAERYRVTSLSRWSRRRAWWRGLGQERKAEKTLQILCKTTEIRHRGGILWRDLSKYGQWEE